MGFEPHWPQIRLLMIDLARKTHTRRALPLLRDSQWWAWEKLEDLQLQKLRRLAAFVIEKTPFYKQLSERTGLCAEDLQSLTDIRNFPVMTKARMKESPAAFLPAGGCGEAVMNRTTGGSTGAPFVFRTSAGAISSQWAAIFRAWEWSGYRVGVPMVTIGGGSVAPAGKMPFSQRVYNGLRRNTPLTASSLGPEGLTAIEEGLRLKRPALVYGYPSVLYQVARHICAQGKPLAGICSVVTTSEMLFPGQRRELERAFGASVFDQYGCNEVNLVTCECEAHDGWHIAMESSLVEILDDNDEPVPVGHVGRIVASGLDNLGMAFLRYDTGDLGALDPEPCSCGRGLAKIVKLQGRTRDLIKAIDGRMIHGVAFNGIILKFAWVDRYQVIQIDEGSLTLNVAATSAVDDGEIKRLEAEIVELCGLEVRLTLNEPFETTSGQKNRVIICHLEES